MRMQCIRQILTADRNFLKIKLPDSFISHQVEIIAFPVKKEVKQKKVSFDPTKFKGFLQPLDIDAAKESRKWINLHCLQGTNLISNTYKACRASIRLCEAILKKRVGVSEIEIPGSMEIRGVFSGVDNGSRFYRSGNLPVSLNIACEIRLESPCRLYLAFKAYLLYAYRYFFYEKCITCCNCLYPASLKT